ncbi:hypothetical protein CPC08DRAFT_730739 [Agrocybe pediades]|nr:hypothetical protein CPC08DRAFT_730739 [Agrocybe pediades]
MAKEAIEEWNGTTPTDAQIWSSLRDKTLSRQTRSFLWKAMHGAYKIGAYWRNLPNHERWADCPLCETEESLQHVFTECRASGQMTIWQEVEHVWSLKKLGWRRPTLGTVLGIPLIKVISTKGRTLKGPTRLLRILLAEATQLIWRLRCEWKITNLGDPAKVKTDNEVRRLWRNHMNSRLMQDMLLTNEAKYRKKALHPSLVEATWWDVLHDKQALGDDWIRNRNGVLVGTGRRPPGRNR